MFIPQRQREAEVLSVVGETSDSILAPAIGAAARLLVAEVLPRGAIRAVILAHRSPLPLAEVGTPLPPGNLRFARFL